MVTEQGYSRTQSENEPFRFSRFIDFNEGRIILDPELFVAHTPSPWTVEQKIDFFECRVEVWQLGVAVEMVKQIEANEPPSIWSHAGYALLSVVSSYFEMVGKVLNPGSMARRTSGVDFNWGFCNVYPEVRSIHSTQSHSVDDYSDSAVPHVAKFRDLMRNGMYHLGFPKKNFLIHNSPESAKDCDVVQVRDQQDGQSVGGFAYFMNPHRVTRRLVDHFAGIIAALRQTSNHDFRNNFKRFFDEFDAA